MVLVAAAPAVAEPHHHDHGRPCKPSASEEAAAARFVDQTSDALARYADVKTAVANGYRPFGPFGAFTKAIAHYQNKAYDADDSVLDSERPESLVYANRYSGDPLLLGALFAMPERDMTGPRFGGCLTQWHRHAWCDGPAGIGTLRRGASCPPGTTEVRTVEMIHVWIVPMEGGPFAHRPDDRYKCWIPDTGCGPLT